MAFDIAAFVEMARDVADNLGLLATVQHYPWTGSDSYGNPQWGAATARRAVVESGVVSLDAGDYGRQSVRTKVTLLEAASVNKLDKFVLPDGSQPQIMRISGTVTAGGIQAAEVWF